MDQIENYIHRFNVIRSEYFEESEFSVWAILFSIVPQFYIFGVEGYHYDHELDFSNNPYTRWCPILAAYNHFQPLVPVRLLAVFLRNAFIERVRLSLRDIGLPPAEIRVDNDHMDVDVVRDLRNLNDDVMDVNEEGPSVSDGQRIAEQILKDSGEQISHLLLL
jgi:hypothetical protein